MRFRCAWLVKLAIKFSRDRSSRQSRDRAAEDKMKITRSCWKQRMSRGDQVRKRERGGEGEGEGEREGATYVTAGIYA